MTLEKRWATFIGSITKQMEEKEMNGAEQLIKGALIEIPPDERSLEWGMRYISLQFHAALFHHTCQQQGRDIEAAIVAGCMTVLNQSLAKYKGAMLVPEEFTKESKF